MFFKNFSAKQKVCWPCCLSWRKRKCWTKRCPNQTCPPPDKMAAPRTRRKRNRDCTLHSAHVLTKGGTEGQQCCETHKLKLSIFKVILVNLTVLCRYWHAYYIGLVSCFVDLNNNFALFPLWILCFIFEITILLIRIAFDLNFSRFL